MSTWKSRRDVLGDLFWRGVQVFIAAFAVNTAAGDYIARLKTVAFWEEIVGAVLTAIISQILAYVSARSGKHQNGYGQQGTIDPRA